MTQIMFDFPLSSAELVVIRAALIVYRQHCEMSDQGATPFASHALAAANLLERIDEETIADLSPQETADLIRQLKSDFR
ncbi:MAG: hypothetical protein R3D51_11765 [Hyphomicrobiaceae bacterium]